MALWARTQQLTGSYLRDVQELYRTRFPMEVRHSIAQWLEAQDWKLIDENSDESRAFHMLEQMEREINEKANAFMQDEQSFPYRLRLLDTANGIKMAYKDNPLDLVRLIRESLFREEQLVRMSCDEPMKQENQVSNTERQILNDMEILRKAVAEAGSYVKNLQQKHEYFVIQYQRNHKTEELLKMVKSQNVGGDTKKQEQIIKQELENTTLKAALQSGAQDLKAQREQAYQHMKEITFLFKNLCHMVFDIELVDWKNLQKHSTFKSDLCDALMLTLTKIQRWCEELASLLNDCKQQMKKLQMLESEIRSTPDGQHTIKELDKEFRSFLNILLLNSFVVDRQPPQVVRKDARFTANVRLLVGHKLNVFMSMPTVEASIISEPQARKIASDGCLGEKMENAGDILNNKGTMEYTQGQMSITFRNMQLKKIKRADRKGQELVVEEKFCILFRAKIQADMKYETWTMSLPIVVTVHGNQECQAQATILWDNSFSDPRRIPFAVPDKASWADLSTLLSCWFHLKTGKGLSFEHLQILAAKLFGEGITDYSNATVTRSQFHKDHLQPGNGKYNFTLWEWFYLAQKVTKDYLKDAWVDGLVMGFVSKPIATEMLKNAPPGTFILRYSDTELGGVSIVYNHIKPGVDTIQVANLLPFTDKDFRIRSLADRIGDLTSLQFLYPATPKHVAFGKYWTRDVETVCNGAYIPHTINMSIANSCAPVNHVESIAAPALSQGYPQPMSNMTGNSMDMDYPEGFDDDLAGYFPEFHQSEFADVMVNLLPSV